MEKLVNSRIQQKYDTSANWTTNNPILLKGEIGIESDTNKVKIGDGSSTWTSLSYVSYLPLDGGTVTGDIRISKGKGLKCGSGAFYFNPDDGYPAIYSDDRSVLIEDGDGEKRWVYFPNEGGTLVVDSEIDELYKSIPVKVGELENDKKYTTEEQVNALFSRLESGQDLSFFCSEEVSVTINGNTVTYPGGSNVNLKIAKDDVFEITPSSNNAIISLSAYPGAISVFYEWLNGVKQFSNILFDMNSEEMYTKWNQNNQGAYDVQFAQYVNCIFWSDNPYIHPIATRTNYTIYQSSQLPLCYSSIRNNTFKPFYLAYGVQSDPNWANDAYIESFSLTTNPTAPFSYYGSRTIGLFNLGIKPIVLPADSRGLMFYSSTIENAGTFDAKNITSMNNLGAKRGSWQEAFGNCYNLKRLYIKNLKVNLNVSWSPIEQESLKYILNNAANTSAITISLSPYTWYRLTDANKTLATSKNINLELISTNYPEDDSRFKNIPTDYVNLTESQTISGPKTFNNTAYFNSSISVKSSVFGGDFTATSSCSPSNSYVDSAAYYRDGVMTIYTNEDGDDVESNLLFPNKSGTFALTNDFKTINGQSILGSGNISISSSSDDYLSIKGGSVYGNTTFENPYGSIEIYLDEDQSPYISMIGEDSANSIITSESFYLGKDDSGIAINPNTISIYNSGITTTYEKTQITKYYPGAGTSFTYTYPDKTGTFALTNDFKTINGQSIIGSGDITISGGSGGSSDVTADMVSIDPDYTLHWADNVQDALGNIKTDLIDHLSHKSTTEYFIKAIYAEDEVSVYDDSDSSNILKDLAFDINMGRSGQGTILEIIRHYRSNATETISFSLPAQDEDYVLKMLTPSTFIVFNKSRKTIVDIASFALSKNSYPLSYIGVSFFDDGASGEYEIVGHVSYEQYTMIDW